MKATILGFTLVILVGLITLAEQQPDAFPPRVTLQEALQIAETYVRTNKLDASQQYLASISIHSDPPGKYYWEASWMHTNKMVRGGFFHIRVHMDKTVTFVGGK